MDTVAPRGISTTTEIARAVSGFKVVVSSFEIAACRIKGVVSSLVTNFAARVRGHGTCQGLSLCVNLFVVSIENIFIVV